MEQDVYELEGFEQLTALKAKADTMFNELPPAMKNGDLDGPELDAYYTAMATFLYVGRQYYSDNELDMEKLTERYNNELAKKQGTKLK